MSEEKLSVRKTLAIVWGLPLHKWMFLLAAFLISLLIPILISGVALILMVEAEYSTLVVCCLFLSLLLIGHVGFSRICHNVVRGEPTRWKDCMPAFLTVINWAVAFILFDVAITVGLALFIIPGIVVLIRWLFFSQAIIDGSTSIQAFSKSQQISEGIFRQIFVILAIVFASCGISYLFIREGAIVLMAVFSEIVITVIYQQRIDQQGISDD